MIKAILFDVDDTLYDLSLPFKEALGEFFTEESMEAEKIFLACRKYNDMIYSQFLKGEISKEELYSYRLEHAFQDNGKIIDTPTALRFQKVYEKKQQTIYLTENMEQLLEALSKKTILGIITNGPEEHQRNKIRALDVERWIPVGRIWISGALGIAKPEKGIFTQAQEKLGLEPEEICYVGDSYGYDMVGAGSVGWRTVWFNHRERRAAGELRPDYEVRTEAELIGLLMRLPEQS